MNCLLTVIGDFHIYFFELVVLVGNYMIFPGAVLSVLVAGVTFAVFHHNALFLSGLMRSIDVGWDRFFSLRYSPTWQRRTVFVFAVEATDIFSFFTR